jgi:photosystem II stability/assembly factor-like uncharacterized protein
MPQVESSTIVRGKQTVYIREHDTLDPFEWLGSCSRALGLTQGLGDIEWTWCQDAANPGKFVHDIEIEGSATPPEGSLAMKKSIRNALQNRMYRCRWDIDVRYYICERLDDPMQWEAIDRICNAKMTEYATEDESAYSPDDDGEVIVTSPFKGEPLLVHMWRLQAAMADTDLTTESILFVAKCSDEQCADECGPATECILMGGTTAVAGNPLVLISEEGGDYWTTIPFDGTGDNPTWTNSITGGDCLGSLHIVVSEGEGAYAWTTDIDGVWTEVDEDEEGNSLATYPPLAVSIFSPSNLYIVGTDGYVWKSTDGGVTISTVDGGNAGDATSENLNAVQHITDMFVVAVGDSNAIIKTENSGATWTAVTGPVAQAGINILAFLGLDKNRWLLGYANGELWVTEDGGDTWEQDESITKFAAIYGFAECGCGRIVMVGEDADADGLIYENVDSGAPGKWFSHSLPAGTIDTSLYDVTCCDANRFIAVGEAQYALGTGAIVVLA